MRPLVGIFLAARLTHTHVTHICISVPNTHHRLIFAAALRVPSGNLFLGPRQSLGTLGTASGTKGVISSGGDAPPDGRTSAASRVDHALLADRSKISAGRKKSATATHNTHETGYMWKRRECLGRARAATGESPEREKSPAWRAASCGGGDDDGDGGEHHRQH
jgi:hypothetical protein